MGKNARFKAEQKFSNQITEKKVALWSKNNFWHVEETIEQVYDKLGLEYKHKKEEVN